MTPTRHLAAAALIVSAAGLILTACGSVGASSQPPGTTTTGTGNPSSPAATTPSPAQATTAAAPPSPAAPAGCATSALKVTLGPSNGAAGSIIYPIVFTNTSSSACTLYGYPGVSFVTAMGSQVGKAAAESPVFPRQLVTLGSGQSAHADFKVTNAMNYPSATCSPVSVQRVKVYPPGQTAAVYVPITATGCANSAVTLLSIQTVQPGS